MKAHASYYLELAGRVRQGIRSPDERFWVQRVDVELANFRAAHSWAVACDNADVALGILSGLWDDAQHRRRFELGEWASDAVKLPGAADHPLRPAALALQALVSQMQGKQDLAAAQIRDRHARFFAEQAVVHWDLWDGPGYRVAVD